MKLSKTKIFRAWGAMFLAAVMCMGLLSPVAYALEAGGVSDDPQDVAVIDEQTRDEPEEELPCSHVNVKENLSEATCEFDGYWEAECMDCGKILDSHVCPRLSHEYVSGKCKYCGQDEPCDHANTKENLSEATCESDGYWELECMDCHKILDSHVCPKLDHEYVDGSCKYCGQEEPGPCEHDWTDWDEIPATCTEDGKRGRHCVTCGETENEILPATGHETEKRVDNEATCTEKGNVTYLCSVCGTELDHAEIDPLGHDAVTRIENEATCTEKGNVTTYCKTCGAELSHDEIAPNGHTWSEWSVTDATCLEDGSRSRECTVCDVSEREVIPAEGHTYGEFESAGADGHSMTCSKCGDVITEAHSMSAFVTVRDATPDEPGLRESVCSVCGHTVQEEIPYESNDDTEPAPVTPVTPVPPTEIPDEDTPLAPTPVTPSVPSAPVVNAPVTDDNDDGGDDELTDIDDEPTPLAPAPVITDTPVVLIPEAQEQDEPVVTEIPEESVPLAPAPVEITVPEDKLSEGPGDGLTDIVDDDIPLSDIPQTGDEFHAAVCVAMLLLGIAGSVWVVAGSSKRRI